MVNLKELRTKAGLTQEELASKCEIQRSTIAMIETGGNKPSFELALKLSKLFTVSEVAKLLKVNRNFVYDLIRNGELEAVKVGSIKVTKDALNKYLQGVMIK